jgi:hypothetical protein
MLSVDARLASVSQDGVTAQVLETTGRRASHLPGIRPKTARGTSPLTLCRQAVVTVQTPARYLALMVRLHDSSLCGIAKLHKVIDLDTDNIADIEWTRWTAELTAKGAKELLTVIDSCCE